MGSDLGLCLASWDFAVLVAARGWGPRILQVDFPTVQMWAGTAWGGGAAAISQGFPMRRALPDAPCGCLQKPNSELGNVNTTGTPPGIWCLRRPLQTVALRAIYNRAGRSQANIGSPSPQPL